jgi:hypothetical protein
MSASELSLVDWVQAEARRLRGERLSEAAVDHLAWSHTGYPGFWHTDHPAAEFRQAVRRSLRDYRCTSSNCGCLGMDNESRSGEVAHKLRRLGVSPVTAFKAARWVVDDLFPAYKEV